MDAPTSDGALDRTRVGLHAVAEWPLGARGQQALRGLLPTATRVLWPRHFDLAIEASEVTYGVSTGYAHIEEPDAYVDPLGFDPTRTSGPFWTAPFGAARRRAELAAPEALTRFFRLGREQAARWRAGGPR